MALLPPPDISAAYIDSANRPSKEFFNWIKSLYASLVQLLSQWEGFAENTFSAFDSNTDDGLVSVDAGGALDDYNVELRTKLIGSICYFTVEVDITDVGTGATGGNNIYISLPFNMVSSGVAGTPCSALDRAANDNWVIGVVESDGVDTWVRLNPIDGLTNGAFAGAGFYEVG